MSRVRFEQAVLMTFPGQDRCLILGNPGKVQVDSIRKMCAINLDCTEPHGVGILEKEISYEV